MLKFIKGNMENIHDVQIFPIIAFLIFFTFFVGLLFYVFTKNKDYIDQVSQLPLEEDDDPNFNINQKEK